MCSSGSAERRFAAGLVYGFLFLMFGVLAPVAVGLSVTLPVAFIGVLGGVALFHALQSWMATAFGGALSLGALASFLITSSAVSIAHIGAPFWGLVFGVATSWLLERPQLKRVWQVRLED